MMSGLWCFIDIRMCQSCGNQTDERNIHRLIYMLLDKGDVQLYQYTGLCKIFQTQRCIYRWAVLNLVQIFFSKFWAPGIYKQWNMFCQSILNYDSTSPRASREGSIQGFLAFLHDLSAMKNLLTGSDGQGPYQLMHDFIQQN